MTKRSVTPSDLEHSPRGARPLRPTAGWPRSAPAVARVVLLAVFARPAFAGQPAAQNPAVPSAPPVAPVGAARIVRDYPQHVVGVSHDGTWATVSTSGASPGEHDGMFRRVELDTGRVLADSPRRVLHGLSALDTVPERRGSPWVPPPDLAAELVAQRDEWLALRAPTNPRFAAGREGVVFGVGWALYASDRLGGAIVRLSHSAGINPRISPDGATVAFEEHATPGPGVVPSSYALRVAPLPGGRPVRWVQGGDDVLGESAAFSPDGQWLYYVGRLAERAPRCLRALAVGRADPPRELGCGAPGADRVEVVYSPARGIAVLASFVGAAASPPGRVALRWVHLPDGATMARATLPGVYVSGGVDDTGLVVSQVGMDTLLLDPVRRTRVRVPSPSGVSNFFGVAWRGPGEIVMLARVPRVVDLRSVASNGVAEPWQD